MKEQPLLLRLLVVLAEFPLVAAGTTTVRSALSAGSTSIVTPPSQDIHLNDPDNNSNNENNNEWEDADDVEEDSISDGLAMTDLDFKPLFQACLMDLPTDAEACDTTAFWDVSRVTDCSSLFWEPRGDNDDWKLLDGAELFQVDLSRWNTSSCTTMRSMFHGAALFDSPLGKWNVKQVTDMSHMFERAEAFDQDLSSWDTSQVTDMSHMFRYASSFQGVFLPWNVSSVKFFEFMFHDAASFQGGGLGGWDVSGGVDDETDNNTPEQDHAFLSMFDGAEKFNQDIGRWDIPFDVKRLNFMFHNAQSFNQDLSYWNVQHIEDFTGMFHKATSYNQTLCWDLTNKKTKHMLEGTNTTTNANTNDCFHQKQIFYETIPEQQLLPPQTAGASFSPPPEPMKSSPSAAPSLRLQSIFSHTESSQTSQLEFFATLLMTAAVVGIFMALACTRVMRGVYSRVIDWIRRKREQRIVLIDAEDDIVGFDESLEAVTQHDQEEPKQEEEIDFALGNDDDSTNSSSSSDSGDLFSFIFSDPEYDDSDMMSVEDSVAALTIMMEQDLTNETFEK